MMIIHNLDFFDQILAKNSKKVSNILNENNYSSEDCVLIIRTILNKSKRLLQIKNAMDAKDNIDQIISNFKPPIFWKDKPMIKKQLQLWTKENVNELISKLNNIEVEIKKNNSIFYEFPEFSWERWGNTTRTLAEALYARLNLSIVLTLAIPK